LRVVEGASMEGAVCANNKPTRRCSAMDHGVSGIATNRPR
jgi:hypothetical protein